MEKLGIGNHRVRNIAILSLASCILGGAIYGVSVWYQQKQEKPELNDSTATHLRLPIRKGGTSVATAPAVTPGPQTAATVPITANPAATPPAAAPNGTAPAVATAAPNTKPAAPTTAAQPNATVAVTPPVKQAPAAAQPAAQPATTAQAPMKPAVPVASAPQRPAVAAVPVKPVAAPAVAAAVAPAVKPAAAAAPQAPVATAVAPVAATPTPSGKTPVTSMADAIIASKKYRGRPDPMQPVTAFLPFPRAGAAAAPVGTELVPPPPADGKVPPPPAMSKAPVKIKPIAAPTGQNVMITKKIKDHLVPPPPPDVMSPGMPGGGNDLGGLAIDQLPLPPSKPMIADKIKVLAVIDDRAIIAFPSDMRLKNRWPKTLTLATGQQFDSIKIVEVTPEGVTVEEDGERTMRPLSTIK